MELLSGWTSTSSRACRDQRTPATTEEEAPANLRAAVISTNVPWALANSSRISLATTHETTRIAVVYRLVHFPPSEHQDLIVEWLWSERQGVFSHETALSLHNLSDVMPVRVHLSLPTAASRRRRKLHEDLMLHYADVPITDRSWITNVPVTTPRRTLLDCALDGMQVEFLRHATEQAVKRGLVGRADLVEVERALNAEEEGR